MHFRAVVVAVMSLGVSACNCGDGTLADAGTGGGMASAGGRAGGNATGGGSAGGAVGGGGNGGGTAGGGVVQVDAGSADAGTVDAGPPDAGLPPCEVPSGMTVPATLYMSIDDEGTLYLNGTEVASQQIPWSTPLVRTLNVNRNPAQPNVVAIEARNQLVTGGLDRAALVDFRLGMPGMSAAPQIFASGTGWKVLLGFDAGITDAGWTAVGFDDSQWGNSVSVAPYGQAPYGNIFSSFGINSSNASWMWAYNAATSPKGPVFEPIYFRKVFYFTSDGGFSDQPTPCRNITSVP